MLSASLRADTRSLHVAWPNGDQADFPFIWLRDNCPSGFHPQTLEREFDLTSVPVDLAPEMSRVDGETIELTWPGANGVDGHVSRFPADLLYAHRPGQPRPDPAAVAPMLWRADLGAGAVPRARASDILTSDEALKEWLIATKRTGLSIVEALEDRVEAGMEVARRIGFLRETNFGIEFDVVSKPDPNNLAYTSHRLPLHTDLTNQELPPGYQFLHCLANEADGGGSLFCDGYAVADDIRRDDRDAFTLLSTVSIPFRFHDADYDIRRRKTVIRLEGEEVAEIHFNAHLADILDLPADQQDAYYRAYRKYMTLSRNDAYLVTLKLKGGEMVVFDNRRVLHGRDAFDPSTGFRHLHGCYVDRGEFDSRIRVLSRES
ncbi:MAG: TauD/TfdA family dioxygenase [Pseudomonadota bacterium]